MAAEAEATATADSPRSPTTHLCADIPGRDKGKINGIVQQANCREEGDNQLWWIDKQASGNYWIRNFASAHRCLNVKGQNGGTETPLNIATCTNIDDQEWQIIHPSRD